MHNNTLQLKIKQRLNKLSSFDYDNIEPWMVVEAFNKAQLEFVRTQLRGYNLRQEADESSKFIMEDLQRLIVMRAMLHTKQKTYVETRPLPSDFLSFKRIDVEADTDCCKDRVMVVDLVPVADVNRLLRDTNSKPSFEWGETFATIQNNRLRVYHNGEFDINKTVDVYYYRLPREISFAGGTDLKTGAVTADVTCEFSDDIAEILVGNTAEILAGDIESLNSKTILQQHSASKT